MRGIRRASKSLLLAVVAVVAGAAAFPGAAVSQLDALPTLSKARLLDIARVEAPPAGIGLRIHADFPDGAELDLGGLPLHSLTADITPTGEVQVIEAHASASSTGSNSLPSCRDTTFSPTGVRWRAQDLPVEWRLRRSSIPDYMGKNATQWAINKAHRAWPRTHTNCSNPDEVNFSWNFLGPTGKRVGYDGVNMIEFGALGSKALAINYTWYKDGRILEVDMRLNKRDYKWRSVPTSERNRFNVGNVVTHEIGHQLGLADLGDPHGGLTMFARISPGETSKMELGRGDIKGAAFVSP